MSPERPQSNAVPPGSARSRPPPVAPSLAGRLAARVLRTVFALAVLGVAVWAILRAVRDTSLAQIATALAGIPAWALGAALALTAISYACLATTEVILVRVMGFKVPRCRSALTSAAAFAASNSLGFSLASQGAVRLRGYGPAGLTHGQIARLTLVVSLAVTLSGIVTAGLTMAAAPLVFAHALGRSVIVICAVALLLMSPAGLWVLAFRGSGPAWLGGGTAAPPTRKARTLGLGLGLGDWLASGAALFVLVPQPTLTGLAIFLVVFVIGSLVSAASGVPGGLGVFEAIVISLTPLVAQTHETAAALLVYRVIYSLRPAFAAAVVAVCAPYLGPVSRLFGFTPLPPLLMAAMLGVVCAYVAVTETAKAWFFRDARRRRARDHHAPGLKPMPSRPEHPQPAS